MRVRPRFQGLKLELLRRGIASRYVHRTIVELQDHYADLESDALAAGWSPREAAALARSRLGSDRSIARAVLAHPELKSWSHRWPWVLAIVRALLALALMPAVPVLYCAGRASAIARWGASVGLAAILTAALLLAMQGLIAFG